MSIPQTLQTNLPAYDPSAGIPRTFHHSGTIGDLLTSLPAIRHMGGGRLLLRLRNTTLHNRMNEADFDYLRPLLLNSGIVTDFKVWEPSDVVHHDLDAFRLHYERTCFTSLIAFHFVALGITDILTDKALWRQAHLHPFLKVDRVRKVPGKYIGVTRTPRHRDGSPHAHYFWQRMVSHGLDEVGVFFGSPEEHAYFEQSLNTKIAYQPVQDALEMAEYIAGVECFAASQTGNFWIATGLQKTTMLETRQQWRWQHQKWSNNECNNRRPHEIMMPYKNYMD